MLCAPIRLSRDLTIQYRPFAPDKETLSDETQTAPADNGSDDYLRPRHTVQLFLQLFRATRFFGGVARCDLLRAASQK